MTNGRNELRSGLEGGAVAETNLSQLDGARGRLIIAGHDVEELARTASFEDAAALLWARDGEGPTAAEVRAALGAGRAAAFQRLSLLGDALGATDAMDALRAGAAH